MSNRESLLEKPSADENGNFASPDSIDDPLINSQVGKYKIIRELGEGRMGGDDDNPEFKQSDAARAGLDEPHAARLERIQAMTDQDLLDAYFLLHHPITAPGNPQLLDLEIEIRRRGLKLN